MEKHLIVLDLDGTLLTDDKRITTRTQAVLNQLKDMGHPIMIATGRPYRASRNYYLQLNLNTPIVNFNGAYVHNPTDHSFGIHHDPLTLSIAKDIVEVGATFKVKNILAEVLDDVFLHEKDDNMLHILKEGNPKITTGNLLEFLKHDPTSILVHPDETNVNEIRKHLRDHHAEVIDHRNWGAPWHVIEIIKQGLHKAVGIKKVADYYQIPKERIIAFGDEDNDLEMIEYVGEGIAMGNAIGELKNIAKGTTLTNTEDGVAHYLIDRFNLPHKKFQS